MHKNRPPSDLYPNAQGRCGVRPSIGKLTEMLDVDDPAFFRIAAELQRLRESGMELTAETITQATAEVRAQIAEDERLSAIPESIVYYVRRSDLVKIGTTAQPMGRFRDLLPDEILAWEPGGRDTEQTRHAQFCHARIRIGREYFRQTDDLMAHIAGVRVEHGAPHPDWPSLANIEHAPSRLKMPEAPDAQELMSAENAADILGVRYNTIQVWSHRGKITAKGTERDGTKLFLLSEIRSLAARSGILGRHAAGQPAVDI